MKLINKIVIIKYYVIEKSPTHQCTHGLLSTNILASTPDYRENKSTAAKDPDNTGFMTLSTLLGYNYKSSVITINPRLLSTKKNKRNLNTNENLRRSFLLKHLTSQ